MAKLYPSMAFTNIKSNRKTYIPYMLSCSLTIALFYIIGSLGSNEGLSKMWGGDMLSSYMSLGQAVTAIFAVIFLFYINSLRSLPSSSPWFSVFFSGSCWTNCFIL